MGKFVRLSTAGFIFTSILVGVENSAEAYLRSNGRMAYFAEHRPLAYEHSEYYLPEFMAEQAVASDSYTIDEYGDAVSDFHGTWYNFDDGHRRTIGPQTAAHILYFLGASTVSSLEVPDNLTLPSQLQARLGNQYKVINLGQGGYFATRELQHLKRLDLRPGDIVIFYDGVIETAAYGKDPREQTITGKLCNALDAYASRLSSAHLACRYADMSLPVLDSDPRIGWTYQAVLQEAERYTTAHGAHFYHFVEPILWFHALDADEQAISNDPFLINGSWKSEVMGYWSEIQKGHKLAHVPGADLTHLLDGYHGLFFDFDHINEHGNAIVARAIAEAIAPTF